MWFLRQSYEVHLPTLLDIELQSDLRESTQELEWVWRLAAWLRTSHDADATDEFRCAAEGHADAGESHKPFQSSQTRKLSHIQSWSGLIETEKVKESETVLAQSSKHSPLQECTAEDGPQQAQSDKAEQ